MDPCTLVRYLRDKHLLDGPLSGVPPIRVSVLLTRYTNFVVSGRVREQYFVKHAPGAMNRSFFDREAAL